MEISEKLRVMSAIEKFPVGGTLSENNLEKMDYLTAKAAVIAYLSRVEEGLSEEGVRNLFADALESPLPQVPLAENKLRLSAGFIEDFGKLQAVRQNNKSYDEMMALLQNLSENYGYTNGISR